MSDELNVEQEIDLDEIYPGMKKIIDREDDYEGDEVDLSKEYPGMKNLPPDKE